jgi:hypothetical protein
VRAFFLEAIMRSGVYWKRIVGASVFVAAGILAAHTSSAGPARQEASASAKPLDYEFFKANVEPIFLKRRPGHARCYACHGSGTGPQYLVPLTSGSTFWDEEQSRKIFINVSRLVDRDDPMSSRFLIHPLSPLAGGDIAQVHGGGRQFESKKDPDWQHMAGWARGQKLASSSAAAK